MITNNLSVLAPIVALLLTFLSFSEITWEDDEIIIRHDTKDSLYVELGKKYQDIAIKVKTSEGVLVENQWVLTAAHVVQSIGPFDSLNQVRFGNDYYKIDKLIIHPDWNNWADRLKVSDLALLKLDRPVEGARTVHLYKKMMN